MEGDRLKHRVTGSFAGARDAHRRRCRLPHSRCRWGAQRHSFPDRNHCRRLMHRKLPRRSTPSWSASHCGSCRCCCPPGRACHGPGARSSPHSSRKPCPEQIRPSNSFGSRDGFPHRLAPSVPVAPSVLADRSSGTTKTKPRAGLTSGCPPAGGGRMRCAGGSSPPRQSLWRLTQGLSSPESGDS